MLELLPVLEMDGLETDGLLNESSEKPSRPPAAQVYFRPGKNVVTPELSADMAKGLGVQVEEVGCSGQGPKHLVFMGANASIGKSNADSDAGSRDVFRQSHLKEAELMATDTGVSISQHTPEPVAHPLQDCHTEDANPMIRAAAEKEPPKACPSEGENIIGKYRAMRTAAAGYESQEGVTEELYQQGIESIEHGLHLLKSSIQRSHSRNKGRTQEPERAGVHENISLQQHPEGQEATNAPSEQAAHGAERDVSSY